MNAKLQNVLKFVSSHKAYFVFALLAALMVVSHGHTFAAPMDTASLDIDFSSALDTIFDYAEMIFVALIPIAAIGIGFKLGGALLGWVGDMLGSAFRFR